MPRLNIAVTVECRYDHVSNDIVSNGNSKTKAIYDAPRKSLAVTLKTAYAVDPTKNV